ncbi:hypothetical protein [Sulfurospirillum arcachonense]|uniref:hypothetical protein n=1 Tax=Sulfurospirillum arcachonense TaxID=57666 RepID=UPI0004688DD1|nr:hypothetical protein [Sulfurospirillum arcachonense]
MAVSPIGGAIYTNQNMNAAAVKQTDFQNRIDMQNVAASAATNEKGKEVREIRPTEETYKIDPEKEHEKEKNEEETGAKEEQITRDTKHKRLKKSDDDETPPTSLLDIRV